MPEMWTSWRYILILLLKVLQMAPHAPDQKHDVGTILWLNAYNEILQVIPASYKSKPKTHEQFYITLIICITG
jgi:hypothetical protein